ncbi:MAG: hypothetical protein HHAS10_03140 [Candidatus Altimarinota bacterium]
MLNNKESLSEKFIRKGFWLYAFSFIIGPLGYLIKMIISRDLSVEEVGMVYGVISFVTFLAMYNDLGCTESLQFFLPKLFVEKDYARAKYLLQFVFRLQISTSFFIYFGVFFLAPWLAMHYFHADVISILRIAGFFFIGINMMHIWTSLLIAIQDTKLSKGAEFARILGTAIGVSILFFSDHGSTEHYMIAWVIGLFIGILFSSFVTWKKYYVPYLLHVKLKKDSTLIRSFMKYSLATLLAGNISATLSQIDMQLIIYLLGTEQAGYYSTYLSVIGIPFMLLLPIVSFLFPVISELFGRGNHEKIDFLTREFWGYFSIIGIWTSFFLFQYSHEITTLFFGDKFSASGDILKFSAPFLLFNILGQIAFQVLAGTGEIKKRTHILVITLFINIILNLLFINLFGAKGSALAVGISWIPLFYLSQKACGIRYEFMKKWDFWKNMIFGTITYFALHLGIERFSDNLPNYLSISIALITYLCIFLMVNKRIIQKGFKMIRNVYIS